MAKPAIKAKKLSPWAFHWALTFTLAFFLVQSLFQYAMGRLIAFLALGHEAGLLVLCLPPLAGMALASWLVMDLFSLSWKESLRFLGLKRLGWQPVIVAVILSIPVLEGYFLAVRNYQQQDVPVSFFPEWPYLLVLFTVSAGFYEELFFRGFLFQSLRTGRSFLSAAFLSSFLWALSHAGNAFAGSHVRVFYPTLMIFLLGLAGAYVFEKSGNAVWAWMIVHVVVDSIGLLNIGNTGLFRAPVGWPMAFVFIGEILCVILAFPLSNWFWGKPTSD